MGKGPVIAGGMDEAAYARLQQQEREWMAEQENVQFARMQEIEDKRIEREAAEIQRQERVKENEEAALEKLEEGISANVKAVKDAEKEEDKDIVLDFYSSLSKGGKKGGSKNLSSARPD